MGVIMLEKLIVSERINLRVVALPIDEEVLNKAINTKMGGRNQPVKLCFVILGKSPDYIIVYGFAENCPRLVARLCQKKGILIDDKELKVTPFFGGRSFENRRGDEYFPCGGGRVWTGWVSRNVRIYPVVSGPSISEAYGLNFSSSMIGIIRLSMGKLSLPDVGVIAEGLPITREFNDGVMVESKPFHISGQGFIYFNTKTAGKGDFMEL